MITYIVNTKPSSRINTRTPHHESSKQRYLIAILGLLALLMLPTASQAQDNCANLSNNLEWTSGLQEIIMTMQAGDMQKAQLQAKALANICMNAPLLNYLQGKIAEELNEKSDALYYYQKASENTYTFAIAPDTAKKIWYARYENEYPEHTEEAIAASKARIAALEAELATEKSETERINNQRLALMPYKEEVLETNKKLMWAGAGIGIAGLAIVGGGIGLLFATKDEKYTTVSLTTLDIEKNEDIDKSVHAYKYKPEYLASWAMIGAGAALAIGGVILTGIYGFKYTHPIGDESLSLHISPADVSLLIAF